MWLHEETNRMHRLAGVEGGVTDVRNGLETCKMAIAKIYNSSFYE